MLYLLLFYYFLQSLRRSICLCLHLSHHPKEKKKVFFLKYMNYFQLFMFLMTTINFCRIFIIPLHTTPGDFFLKNRPTCDCVLSCILKFMLFHKSLTTATVALAHVMIADAVTHRAYVGTILLLRSSSTAKLIQSQSMITLVGLQLFKQYVPCMASQCRKHSLWF